MKASIMDRLKYRFENFMARGGKSIFVSLLVLFLVSFVLVMLVKAAIVLFKTGSLSGALDSSWEVFMQLIDPGNVSGEKGLENRTIGMLATLLGVVIFSMLIAFITTLLEKLIYKFRKGQSKVFEEDHTLILGWNERVFDIISELVIANESEKRAAVVILAKEDKEMMDDQIMKQIHDLKTTHVITRSGDPASLTEFKRVNAAKARSAIILASCSENGSDQAKELSDTQSIKSIMALIACQNGENRLPVIAEIFNEEKRRMMSYFDSEHIISIDSWDILGKLLVQTSLTSGLEMVYNEMLSFDGCEVYFYENDWQGEKFYQLPYHFVDGVPLGIYKKDGMLVMRPEKDAVMQKGDQIVILAEDDSTIKYRKNPIVVPKELPFSLTRLEKTRKKILLLGWHCIGNILAKEYADYLSAGSQIDVVLREDSLQNRAQIEVLQGNYPDIPIKILAGDPMDLEQLRGFDPFSYDNIIILSQDEEEHPADKIDSDTLMILLLLRKIRQEQKLPADCGTHIITQVLNSENQELITQTDADDFIISNKLITMILAQLSEQPKIKKLYDDLFQEEGSEIYVKPATLYFDSFPAKVSFADLMALANKREEICLGLRKGSLARDAAQNFGVKLNPPKEQEITITEQDYLVVLSEDEL